MDGMGSEDTWKQENGLKEMTTYTVSLPLEQKVKQIYNSGGKKCHIETYFNVDAACNSIYRGQCKWISLLYHKTIILSKGTHSAAVETNSILTQQKFDMILNT